MVIFVTLGYVRLRTPVAIGVKVGRDRYRTLLGYTGVVVDIPVGGML